jgi:hypothetical protein
VFSVVFSPQTPRLQASLVYSAISENAGNHMRRVTNTNVAQRKFMSRKVKATAAAHPLRQAEQYFLAAA